MTRFNRTVLVVAIVFALGAGAGALLLTEREVHGQSGPSSPALSPYREVVEREQEEKHTLVVPSLSAGQASTSLTNRPASSIPAHAGSLTVPALVAKQEHPQVVSVQEAATDPAKLDRVSALAAGQPFDHELWRDESQRADYLASYVSTVGPQRIFDTKTPGEGVRGIRSVGDTEFDVPVEGVITLSVRTDPGAPVNLLSDGLGVFHETGLTAFTTLADETGLAVVEWRAVTGTIGDVVVVAGSPTRSGNVRFFITVHDHQTSERSGAVE